MSAEVLRRAAEVMRADEDGRWAPVADWLEDAAAFLAAYSGYTHAEDTPLRVARAYLGESA